MATHKVNLDALVQLQEDLSGTISDFGELEVEDLSDMISDTRQKLSEIVVRAEEKIKYRESQLSAAIQARLHAEEMARSSEDGSMEVSSYYYEHEMQCRADLENARNIYDSIKNLPDSYDDMASQYYRSIDDIKASYEKRINEGNKDLENVIAAYVHLSGLTGSHAYVGDVKTVGTINEAIGLRAGETASHCIMKPSTGAFSTISHISEGKCFKMTTIPSSCVLLSLNNTGSGERSLELKGATTVTKNGKGIKYKIREKRPISSGSKQFANTHVFQYPSISPGCIEQFDGFLKNELRSRAPFSISIPSNAFITAEQMNVYDQVKYEWSDDEYAYTCRWHTRTKNAPIGQGDTWVLHRHSTINEGKTKEEYLVGDSWVSGKEFKKSDEYRRLGHVADDGRFVSILGEVIE